MGNPLLAWIQSYLGDRFQFVDLLSNKSENVKATSGVPQGGHLSPLLFNIFINIISKIISPCRTLLFTDDAKIFYKIQTPEDCIALHDSIFKLVDWCNLVGLSLNFNKCKVMTFFRTHSYINFDYLMYKFLYFLYSLPRVDQVEDLGFTLVPFLSFSIHVELITCKALRTLGFIRRNASNFDQANCLVTLYTSLVRSILEYGSLLWSPYTQKDIQRIERVQNRFLVFAGYVLKITHPPHDYTSVSNFLNLSNLEIRRNLLDIRFLNNLVLGKTYASRLLERVKFHILRNGSRSKIMFEISTRRTNYLCNDSIQRTMIKINLDPRLLEF